MIQQITGAAHRNIGYIKTRKTSKRCSTLAGRLAGELRIIDLTPPKAGSVFFLTDAISF